MTDKKSENEKENQGINTGGDFFDVHVSKNIKSRLKCDYILRLNIGARKAGTHGILCTALRQKNN
jgi:hypothetical protein